MNERTAPSLGDEHLSSLIAHTDILVAASDVSGRVTLMSPELEKLLGPLEDTFQEADFLTRFALYDENGRPLGPEDLILARACRGEIVRDQLVVLKREDRTYYLRCAAGPIRDDDGGILGGIAFSVDVTAERLALQRQRELRERLVETVNHELRTPLATVLGHAELLLDSDTDLPAWARDSVRRLAGAGSRLRELAETLSLVADLDGFADVARELVDLRQVVDGVVANLRPRAADKRVTITVTGTDSWTWADQPKVWRALSELLTNAITYSPDGGDVLLRVDVDDLDVVLTVEDHGPGIPEADRERVTAAFERGHSVDGVSSRGLGLALAATVAGAHGGRLELCEAEPSGLRVRFVLPGRETDRTHADGGPGD